MMKEDEVASIHIVWSC